MKITVAVRSDLDKQHENDRTSSSYEGRLTGQKQQYTHCDHLYEETKQIKSNRELIKANII